MYRQTWLRQNEKNYREIKENVTAMWQRLWQEKQSTIERKIAGGTRPKYDGIRLS